MKKVCLKVGLSYTTKGFSCVKGNPVNVEDDIAAKLLQTGRFEIVNEVVKETPPLNNGSGNPNENGSNGSGQHQNPPEDPNTEQLSASKIGHMKTEELIALAEKKGIDISECKTNNDKAAKICEMLGLASNVNLGL